MKSFYWETLDRFLLLTRQLVLVAGCPYIVLLTARLVPPQSFYFALLAPTKIGSLRGFVKIFVGFKRKIVGIDTKIVGIGTKIVRIGTKILSDRRFFDRKPPI